MIKSKQDIFLFFAIMKHICNQSPYEEAIAAFLGFCHQKIYPKRASIIKIGDTGDKLLFIVEGSVAVCAENEDDNTGTELVLAYLNQNEFIGEIGIFKGAETRKVNVRAREACILAEISYERFQDLLQNELLAYAPRILFVIGEQLSSRLLATSRKLCQLNFIDVQGRIARLLLDLCKSPEAITHPDGMQLHISRQEIGRIVGCSREVAGRILKDLEAKGTISSHGKTIVVYGTR